MKEAKIPKSEWISEGMYGGKPELIEAYQKAVDIEDCFHEHDVKIKIRKKDYDPCYGDGFRFLVKLKDKTRVEQINKLIPTVRLKLKLPNLRSISENGCFFLVTSSNNLTLNNNLLQIISSDKYKSVFEIKEIAHPVGIRESGDVMICDLEDYPHVMVSGTTRSGKSTALKCLLVSLLKYPPCKMNLLLADRGWELNKFSGLPHLSAPIIQMPEDLVYALSFLHDEMERRIKLMQEDHEIISTLPYIVYIVDEFPWFIGSINSKKQAENFIKQTNDILRFGRNTKIHVVLSIHDPKDSIALIEKSDIPVSMVFHTANIKKSVNSLDSSGAEKLKGEGDMNFRYKGETHHLQGVYISDEEIDKLVHQIIKRSEYDRQLPRGEYGFSISDKDIKAKKAEAVRSITDFPIEMHDSINNDMEQKFAEAILWVLSQVSVSINLIKQECHLSNANADKLFKQLQKYGIISDFTVEKGRCKVCPHSIDEIPDELTEHLSRQGITDDAITKAIEKRSTIWECTL